MAKKKLECHTKFTQPIENNKFVGDSITPKICRTLPFFAKF